MMAKNNRQDGRELYQIMFKVIRELNHLTEAKDGSKHNKDFLLYLLPTIDGSLIDNRKNVDLLVNLVKERLQCNQR